jgi:predicted small lipoprotein YifL
MKRLTLLIAALAIMFIFSGCGQSGPLYIPGNPTTMAVPPAEPATNEDDTEEDQDSSESSEAD